MVISNYSMSGCWYLLISIILVAISGYSIDGCW